MSRLTYKYRIYPFGDQIKVLESWLESCRKLYNTALEQRKLYKRSSKKIGYPDQQRDLTSVRHEFEEYQDMPVHVLQNVLLRLDRAVDNFYRRCKERKSGKKIKLGFPRFKSFGRYSSFTCPDKYNYIRGEDLYFPKLGRIRMEMHRPLPVGAEIKTCTIKKDSDGWYVFFSLEVPDSMQVEPKPKNIDTAIGMDLGLSSFIASSEGNKIDAPKFLIKSEEKLKKAQRVLSRRKKGSNRYKKQRDKVARIHCHIAHQREDFLNKVAIELARKYSFIAVEDLRVQNMVKNHCLAKAISDVSWSLFTCKLEHAVVKTGSKLVKVNPAYTSCACSSCGWVDHSMTLKDRTFHCKECGLVLDRDVNAAKNILHLGWDTPEVTRVETQTNTFRFQRRASLVDESRTVLEAAYVA